MNNLQFNKKILIASADPSNISYKALLDIIDNIDDINLTMNNESLEKELIKKYNIKLVDCSKNSKNEDMFCAIISGNIYLNKSCMTGKSAYKSRFTIPKCIGHYVLHSLSGKKDIYIRSEYLKVDDLDVMDYFPLHREASVFSAAYLFRTKLIQIYLDRGLSFDEIAKELHANITGTYIIQRIPNSFRGIISNFGNHDSDNINISSPYESSSLLISFILSN